MHFHNVVTQKGRSCIPWNLTSPKKAHENMFIRINLPLICRGLFPHYCVLWGRIKPWGVWAPKQTIPTQLGRGRYRWYQSHALVGSVGPTREDSCAHKGWIVVTQKGGGLAFHRISYRLEKHMNMFIRIDIPLMSIGLFTHCCVLWKRTKLWEVWAPKGQYLYSWGGAITQKHMPCYIHHQPKYA